LNPQPTAYKAVALPLSYASIMDSRLSEPWNYHQESCSLDSIFFPKNFDDSEDTEPVCTTLILCFASTLLPWQHFLNFNPEPHGHKSFLDTLDIKKTLLIKKLN
jgi:hypothetical protein